MLLVLLTPSWPGWKLYKLEVYLNSEDICSVLFCPTFASCLSGNQWGGGGKEGAGLGGGGGAGVESHADNDLIMILVAAGDGSTT